MIQGSFAVTTLLSSSCLRFIRGFTKSMQLAVRKITANTRDPSAVIAISTRAGREKKKVFVRSGVLQRNTRDNELKCIRCHFTMPLSIYQDLKGEKINSWISGRA